MLVSEEGEEDEEEEDEVGDSWDEKSWRLRGSGTGSGYVARWTGEGQGGRT